MAYVANAGRYKVNAVTTVYGAGLARRGSYSAGSIIEISGPLEVNATQYGIIGAGQTAGFEGYTPDFKDPAGCAVMASSLQALDASGNELQVNTAINMDVWVKTGATCTIWNSPQFKLAAQGSKSSGEQIHIYGTVRTSDGMTYGFIDPQLTKTVILYTVGTNMASNLTNVRAGWPLAAPPMTGTGKDVSTASGKAYQSLTSNPVTSAVEDRQNIEIAQATEKAYTNTTNVSKAADRLRRLEFNMTTVDTQSLEVIENMHSVLGIPPLMTEAADPKYISGVDFGRSYSELFMMNNCVFSILPCKVRYLPGFSQDKKTQFFNTIGDLANYGQDSNLMSSANGLSGQLFEAVQDYDTYMNTVNLLARVFAIYLGIGDKQCPGTSSTYANANYQFYRRFNKAAAGGSLFSSVGNFVSHAKNALIDKAINNDAYTHFYMTADGTSMSDSMTVQTCASSIEGLFNNGLSELGREIQFLMGGSLDEGFVNELLGVAEGLGSSMSSMGGIGSTLGNMFMYGANYLRGGRLVFPQMLDDCTYDRSYTGSCRFISPSGDAEARFMNCYLPLSFLLPYVLPQMMSDNMYTYPFVCKVDVPGQVHCDLAAMTGLRIQRGGPEGQSWTVDGLPFEIDVTFDITPLYSKLMVTTTDHPVLFLGNNALHEYMASMCGVDFTGDELSIKAQIAMALFNPVQVAKDRISSLFRSYYDSGIAEGLRKVFNF